MLHNYVSNVTVDSCYLVHATQNIMAGDCKDITISNNVAIGCESRNVILKAASQNWTMRNNTLGLAVGNSAIGSYSTTGTASSYSTRNHLYYFSTLYFVTGVTPPVLFDTDYSLFWSGTGTTYHIAGRTSPWKAYDSVGAGSALYADLGQELHSYRADPQMRNVPLLISSALETSSLSRLDLKYSWSPTTYGFHAGDVVEVNGDSIPRTITSIDSTSINISPELTDYLVPPAQVSNWGPNPVIDENGFLAPVDTRLPDASPYLTAGDTGGPIGSTIDITAYVYGDFNGDGVRDIPEMPADLEPAYRMFGCHPYFGIAAY